MPVFVSMSLRYTEPNLILSELNVTRSLTQAEEWSNTKVSILIVALDNTIFCIDSVCEAATRIQRRTLRRRPVSAVLTKRSATYFSNSAINSIKPWHYKC